jgi:hypothetical protein
MTDPNETADLVDAIATAYREQQARNATERPTTWAAAGDLNIDEQKARYDALSHLVLMTQVIAEMKARGQQVSEAINEVDYPPLTAAEHLERVALGERIALYYRHPSQVDRAIKAGATWQQIADARGITTDQAQQDYREWIKGQHRYAGMSDTDYAAAIERAGQDI